MLERFLNEKINRHGNRLDEDTKVAYRFDIGQFMEHVGKNESEITYNDISEWFGHYREQYSTATMSRKIMALKSYFKWLTAIGYISENPIENFQTFTPKSKEKVPLTVDEVNAIIRQGKNSRDKAIVQTLASTGIRVSELIDMKLSDLDSETVVIHGKGDKDRVISVSNKTRGFIKEYLKSRKDCDIDNIFVSNNGTEMKEKTINKTLKALAKRAGIEDWKAVSPHLFRCTYASLLAENNVPIPTVQKILGHSRIETTMRYIKTNNTQVVNAMNIDLY